MGAPAKKKSAFTKAASIPARHQSDNTDPRLFGFIFRRSPPILNIFSNISSSALKRHLLKRHLTLSSSLLRGQCISQTEIYPVQNWSLQMPQEPSQHTEDHPPTPHKKRLIWHKSRSSYAIKVGLYTIFSVKVPLFSGILTTYDSILCHILGAYFLLIWGVGVVETVFTFFQTPAPVLDKSELIFGKGMRTATFQLSESGGSLNRQNLFTEFSFPVEILTKPPIH